MRGIMELFDRIINLVVCTLYSEVKSMACTSGMQLFFVANIGICEYSALSPPYLQCANSSGGGVGGHGL